VRVAMWKESFLQENNWVSLTAYLSVTLNKLNLRVRTWSPQKPFFQLIWWKLFIDCCDAHVDWHLHTASRKAVPLLFQHPSATNFIAFFVCRPFSKTVVVHHCCKSKL